MASEFLAAFVLADANRTFSEGVDDILWSLLVHIYLDLCVANVGSTFTFERKKAVRRSLCGAADLNKKLPNDVLMFTSGVLVGRMVVSSNSCWSCRSITSWMLFSDRKMSIVL